MIDQNSSKEDVLQYLMDKNQAKYFKDASKELKGDKDVVMAAINHDAFALEYASDSLKSDEDVVIAAIKKNGMAFYYAAPALKRNKNIVLLAVQNAGYILSNLDC